MNVVCSNMMVNLERSLSGARDLKKAGFDCLATGIGVWSPDFYGWHKDKPIKPRQIDLKPVPERYAELFAACRENKIRIPIVYGPSYGMPDPSKYRGIRKNFTKEDGSVDEMALETVEKEQAVFVSEAARECIEFCGANGVRYIRIPPVTGDRTTGREWEINRDFYLGLSKKARKCNVQILLQNMYKDVNGHLVRGVCSNPFEAAEWVDRLNEEAETETFGFCLDVGTCNLCGNDIHEFIITLADRIKAVILRDCDGQHDQSLLPFSCVNQEESLTDWMGLIRGLRDINFDGELIVNCFEMSRAFSPLLRPTLFQFAREVGEYIRWQIQLEQNLKKYKSIVLFGAGNMCRNYMKCYGEKYPPLFTCDNNPKLWDTKFEGLTVKNPEELKNLPDDCGVYICNIYYREIETQLKEMGIKNIEYFNDEYMPTFYFDRLERDEE